MSVELLGEALERLGMAGAVVFDQVGREVRRFGALESIASEGMFRALFGGIDEVQRLRASLQGQVLPQIWSQGNTTCFVSQTESGTLYAVFLQKSLDPVALYRVSTETARTMEELLEH
jgi:hypothetical protein